ncbi:4Fe-4S dicluster domain-containing protein [Bryobacter aggregatus]|uniref:4Fe-4S dicluster domain-containing protein n=1 Tax=Bryobacter aggregatus TaxID=360054 RepID=UPI0006909621|nr:4Fe-4S dicluster domain-containing protein [Bryobacter aggregatus]
MSLVQISNVKKNRMPLDQLGQTPEFQGWANGLPTTNDQELDSNSRRDILKIMAAGAGLAGLASCRRPPAAIVSFSRGVEDLIPGKPLYYNTVYNLGGTAQGLRIEANDGRPTKVEGNPVHPAAKGAATTYSQGSVLSLYDPDRCSFVMKDGASSTWEAFESFAKQHFSSIGDGTGLAFVSERNAGDSFRAVVAAAQKKFPKALWLYWEPINNDNAVLGTQLATGALGEPNYSLDKAEVILSLDNDFLGTDATSTLPTKQFSKKRRVEKAGDEMNRLYVVEGHYSLTGAMADNRLRLKPSEVAGFAAEVLKLVQESGEAKVEGEGNRKFAAAVAKDLKKNAGKSVVLAGPRQSPQVHATVLAINQVLGNIGTTVSLLPALTEPQGEALKTFGAALAGGQISTLVILGGNPAYTMPSDLNFAENAKKAKTVIHIGMEHDETAAIANWCLPQAHYLEDWGDGRAADGTASIQQPVIAPLLGGRTPTEVLAIVTGLEKHKAYDIVKAHWTAGFTGDKEKAWRKALHDGIIEGTAFAPLKASVDVKKVAALPVPSPSNGTELVFLPSVGVYDGRFANNAWLIELPDPMTKVVWDNCVTMSKKTAESLKAEMGYIGLTGDMVNLSVNGATIEAAVVIMPGQADGVLAIGLGYGREKVGRVGKGAGFNAYKLRNSASQGYATGINVSKNAKSYMLVRTQDDPDGDWQHDRGLVRETTLADFKKEPSFAQEVEGPPLESLFPDWGYDKGNQWGMTIDLNVCTGCNACLVACFSENNIPMVGKKFVAMGREMHWIRLDRYFVSEGVEGVGEDPQVVVQPLNCQQCENAPCESVCPVAATVHSPEGLNDMAYNRCIGTRYCMNNCPYKVRKFNYLNWTKGKTEFENLGSNPDVSTRMRGVMEKCTYCTQRIVEGKINAKTDPAGRRAVRDGEIQTACQQTCPADAIAFGNINDPNAAVSKLKASSRNYALLAELNVRPRTTYLAKLRNPNPELTPEKKAPAAH